MQQHDFEKAAARIQQMEQYFDTLQSANPTTLQKDASLRACLLTLTQYYEGGQWLRDYELDEAGFLPPSLKRGVLAQDAVYNFLEKINHTTQGERTMEVTYIYHSGFLVETAQIYYIFDYWKGELPKLNPDKPIVVFSSHAHPDHYEPKIFDLLKAQGMNDIYAVLGKDIPKGKYPEGIECLRTLAHKTFTLPHGEELYTLQSTDAGVAFLLTCPEGVIYHAGDLNDWVWEGEPEENNRQMTLFYRRELNLIANRHIDIAFVPLDARQERLCYNGLSGFLDIVTDVQTVYPMHYWDKPELIRQFVEQHPQYQSIVQNPEAL